MIGSLPTINALLNLTATALLVIGWVQIRRGRETAHRNLMIAAFGTSVAFLACYLVYHAQVGSRPFPHTGAIRPVYFTILISHIVLAATVPVLAGVTLFLGLTGRRRTHRRVARVTFPIWLYVSVTGVVIYLLLYQLPAAG